MVTEGQEGEVCHAMQSKASYMAEGVVSRVCRALLEGRHSIHDGRQVRQGCTPTSVRGYRTLLGVGRVHAAPWPSAPYRYRHVSGM